MTRATHGMFVSMKVGSVSPVLIITTSALRATRIAMWLFAPSIVPMIPHTSSVYACLMISLPEEPQRPLSFESTSSKGIFRFVYPPRAFHSSTARRDPCSMGIPSASSWLLPPVATETVCMIGPMKPILTLSRFSGSGFARPAPQ